MLGITVIALREDEFTGRIEWLILPPPIVTDTQIPPNFKLLKTLNYRFFTRRSAAMERAEGSGSHGKRRASNKDKGKSKLPRIKDEESSIQDLHAVADIGIDPSRNSATSEEHRCTPRGRHIRTILRVFRNRQVGWGGFGQFLVWLFRDAESPLCLERMRCHHWNDSWVIGSNQSIPLSPYFRGEILMSEGRYPCQTTGYNGFNKGSGTRKATGRAAMCAVRQVRVAAREWCYNQCLGRQDWETHSLEEEYLIADFYSNSQFDVTSDPTGDTLMTLFVPDRVPTLVMESQLRPWSRSSDGKPSSVLNTPAKAGKSKLRDDSQMAVHILAVLAYVAEFRPSELAERTKALIRHEDVLILHLCGCGISLGVPNPTACCEPTHLYPGDALLNKVHEHGHWMLKQAQTKDEYQGIRGVIGRSRSLVDSGYPPNSPVIF